MFENIKSETASNSIMFPTDPKMVLSSCGTFTSCQGKNKEAVIKLF